MPLHVCPASWAAAITCSELSTEKICEPWQNILVGRSPTRLEAIATRVEAIATRLDAEAIAARVAGIATRVEAITTKVFLL